MLKGNTLEVTSLIRLRVHRNVYNYNSGNFIATSHLYTGTQNRCCLYHRARIKMWLQMVSVSFLNIILACICKWVECLSLYIKPHSYLVILYFVFWHDEGYDELVAAQGQVQGVVVCVVIYQSYVCSNHAAENVSDLHVMGFCCHDLWIQLLLAKTEYIMSEYHNTQLPLNKQSSELKISQ
jgi:hypothetical protein